MSYCVLIDRGCLQCLTGTFSSITVPSRYSESCKPPRIHTQLVTKGFSRRLVAWVSALGFSALQA